MCVCVGGGVCVKKTFPIQCWMYKLYFNGFILECRLVSNLFNFKRACPSPWRALFKEEKNARNTYSSRSHNFCKDGNHDNAIIIMKIKNEIHYILIKWLILLKLYNVSGHACPIMPMQIQCVCQWLYDCGDWWMYTMISVSVMITRSGSGSAQRPPHRVRSEILPRIHPMSMRLTKRRWIEPSQFCDILTHLSSRFSSLKLQNILVNLVCMWSFTPVDYKFRVQQMPISLKQSRGRRL